MPSPDSARLALVVALGLVLAGCVGSSPAPQAGEGEPGIDEDQPPGRDSPGENENSADRPSNRTSDEPYRPGWPPKDEALIRPGTTVNGGVCTSNYVFRSPDNRTLYLASAAHCFDEESSANPVEVGEEVAIAGGEASGILVYNSQAEMREDGENHGVEMEYWNDLGLIEIPDEFRDQVHPAVLHFGGPTGLAAPASQGDEVVNFGNSTFRDGARPLDPRRGIVEEEHDWWTEYYPVPTSGVFGDSGSPVMTRDGEAIGLLSGIQLLHGTNGAGDLDDMLGYLHEQTNITVELATWHEFSPELLDTDAGASGGASDGSIAGR
jgi:hypothetical protein